MTHNTMVICWVTISRQMLLQKFCFLQFLLFQYQSGKEIKTKLTMDLIIFIVGFIIFVVYLIAFLTVIYRQNKIQDQELENDPELDNK